MRRKKGARALLALLLALGLVVSAVPAAGADSLYPEDQYYRVNASGAEVYAVQVYATSIYEGAVLQRDKMLGQGYDSYLIQREANGLYYVLCGKFQDRHGAELYCASILNGRERKDAYVTRIRLPQRAVWVFQEAYDNRNTATVFFRPARLSLEPDSFPTGQYYQQDQSRTHVFTVQVAATGSRNDAESLRDSMQKAGYDSFLYLQNGTYLVMCGKFRSYYDALAYGEYIHADRWIDQAFVNDAWLPEEMVKAFEDVFYRRVSINSDYHMVESWWEEPLGPFFRDDGAETVTVYTVQVSAGTSFYGSEQLRDELIGLGFPAFVYKIALDYRIMTGMFPDRSEAQQYCAQVRQGTGRRDATVTTAHLPAEEVEAFLAWWESAG